MGCGMRKKLRFFWIIAFVVIIGFLFITCPDPGLPLLTGTVNIIGIAQIGQTLEVNTSLLGGSGTISYQWKRENINIGTNTNTYTIQPADEGYAITVTVTRSGNSGNVTSTQTAIITEPSTMVVTVAMWDSYGDGWNGAALRINVNGINLSPNATISNGSLSSYTFFVNFDDIVSFYWVKGQYDNECAFAVYYSNELPDPPFNPSSSSWTPANDPNGKVLLHRQYNTLGSVSNNFLLGSFTVFLPGVIPDLPPLTGTVSINGTAEVGQILTANTTSLDGSGDIFYQWKSDDVNIGTDSNAYTITQNDSGSLITVTVTRSENFGNITSNPIAVQNLNTGIVIDPSIKLYMDGIILTNDGTSTISQGEGILNIGFDSSEGGITGYTDIIWYINGNIVAQGAARTSFILSNQIEGTYHITVVAVMPGNIKNSGSHTFIIRYGNISLPVLSGSINISGNGRSEQVLTATASLVGSGVISYQWKRDGVNIGTNSNTYTVQPEDGGSLITVTATCTGFSGSITSTPIEIFNTGIIVDPSLKLYMDGNPLANGGSTIISQSTGVININFETAVGSSTGTANNPIQLTSDDWVNSSITSTSSDVSIWYSLPVTNGNTYRVWWNTAEEGRSFEILVNAQYSNGSSIFSVDSWNYWSIPQQFTANQTGIVIIRVQALNSDSTGNFSIVYTENNSIRPTFSNLVTWYINGNIVAQGSSRSIFTLPKNIEGTYHITVEANHNGIRNTGSHTIEIRYGNISLPVLTGTVSVNGIAKAGQTLTATASLGGSGTISYQWKRDGVNIGTNSNTYIVRPEDGGSLITVTTTRTGFSGSITSVPIEILNIGIIVDPSLKLYMNGNLLANGETTTISHGSGIINISFDSVIDIGKGTENDPFKLLPGGWENGLITSTSNDASIWYSFPVTNGATYRIWWDDRNQGSGNRSLDVIVGAKYENGVSVFSNIDNGWNSPQQFTANQTGVVKLKVQPLNTSATGSFGIVYTANNNTRPTFGSTGADGYIDIIWYLNGNVISQGSSKTTFALSRQIRGTYHITIEATPIRGIKNSSSHTLIIQ